MSSENIEYTLEPMSGRVYLIENAASNLIFAIANGSTAVCAKLVQSSKEHNVTHKQFKLERKEGMMWWTITPYHVKDQVLDVTDSSREEGTQIIQHPPHSGENQRWFIKKDGENFIIENVNSGLVAQPKDNSLEHGAPIVQMKKQDNNPSQRFRLIIPEN
jgi:hypothetical protein